MPLPVSSLAVRAASRWVLYLIASYFFDVVSTMIGKFFYDNNFCYVAEVFHGIGCCVTPM
jgi:hypothetical protein